MTLKKLSVMNVLKRSDVNFEYNVGYFEGQHYNGLQTKKEGITLKILHVSL